MPAAQPGPVDASVRYLLARQTASGGFAEPGAEASPGLTAWALAALTAARTPDTSRAREYLRARADELRSATDVELAVVALAPGGPVPTRLTERLEALRRPSGAIGPTVNATIWGILAFRALGRPAPAGSVRYVLRRQARSGGWGWAAGVQPDTNDTAAAVQALRAAGVRGRPIARALRFLRRHQNRDGGFELSEGRGSDVQSTAWAAQAFLAAGAPVPRGAYAYLARMRRADGSYRYSARYAVTPVWVTAQAVPALARKPFPLR